MSATLRGTIRKATMSYISIWGISTYVLDPHIARIHLDLMGTPSIHPLITNVKNSCIH